MYIFVSQTTNHQVVSWNKTLSACPPNNPHVLPWNNSNIVVNILRNRTQDGKKLILKYPECDGSVLSELRGSRHRPAALAMHARGGRLTFQVSDRGPISGTWKPEVYCLVFLIFSRSEIFFVPEKGNICHPDGRSEDTQFPWIPAHWMVSLPRVWSQMFTVTQLTFFSVLCWGCCWKCQHLFSVHANIFGSILLSNEGCPHDLNLSQQTVNASLVCSISSFVPKRNMWKPANLHGSEERTGGFLSNFYISPPAMPPPGCEKRIMTARAPSTCAQLHQLLRGLNMDPWIEDRGWK